MATPQRRPRIDFGSTARDQTCRPGKLQKSTGPLGNMAQQPHRANPVRRCPRVLPRTRKQAAPLPRHRVEHRPRRCKDHFGEAGPEAQRRHFSKVHWGRKWTEKQREFMSALYKGKKLRLGSKMPQAAKDRIGAAHRGKRRSEEWKRKISESNKGKKRSADVIERIRQSKVGIKQSPETIEKRAASLRAYPVNPMRL